VCGAILNARTNFHFVAIASNLTPANGAIGKTVGRHGGALWRASRQPRGRTRSRAEAAVATRLREASTLAYADAFRAIMIAFVIATLVVPLLRNVAPSGAGSSQAH